MDSDPGLIAHVSDGLNTVQKSFARRPKLDFFDESEHFYPFAVESPSGRLGSGCSIAHANSPSWSVGGTGKGFSWMIRIASKTAERIGIFDFMMVSLLD